MSSSNRYQIRRGSQSSHCCFVATVVDTYAVIGYGRAKSGRNYHLYETVAEFFDRSMARLTCNALNAAASVASNQETFRRVRDKQTAVLRGQMRSLAANRSPEVAALRAARALKKLNKENSNG